MANGAVRWDRPFFTEEAIHPVVPDQFPTVNYVSIQRIGGDSQANASNQGKSSIRCFGAQGLFRRQIRTFEAFDGATF